MNICHYCSAPLTKAYEYDHFPIPERHGGTDTVAVCVPCHDLKDRFRFEDWPAELIRNIEREFKAVSEQFSRHFQLILAAADADADAVLLIQEFPEILDEFERARSACWPKLGRESRILIAKLSYLMQDIKAGGLG